VGTSPQTVNYNASGSQVTATPTTGYHFISWSDGVLTAARTDANITADKSVTATFVSVVITPTSSTEFTVSWNNVPTAENGFEVYIALGAADCAIASYDSAANYTLAAGATSQSVTSYNMIPANFIDYNTQYCAKVVALTASGPSDPMFAQPKYTFAQTPTRPTVNTQTSDSLTVKINQTANPASTEFAVKVVKGASTRYLKTDGTLTTDSAPVWATYAAFGGDSGLVNAGLVFDADYIYSVAARNGEGIETDYSDINTIHPPVASTTCTWDGGGSDNSWSTPANWSDDVAPSATCDVVFNSTSAKDSIVNAGFTSHIKSFSVNTGYSGTISASNTLYDDGNFILNSGTFTANAQTLNIGGSLTIAAAPTAVFDKGTSTINLNPIDTGKTIRTNGQAIGILTFNGVDNVVDPNVKANNSLSLLANGTLVAGWTLQDSLSTTSIMVNAGTLVDGGKSVTVAGDIIIANKIGVLASTGLWTQSASGNIANPVMQNAFGSLTVAGEGVTTTLTNSIRVGICTGSAGKLTMGPGTLVGQGKALTVYPKTNDSLTVNNLTAGSRIGSLTIYPLAANLTQKAITLPDSFTTLVQIQQGITGILTATGNFDFGRSTCRFVKDNSYAPIGYVDMGSYNLHCNNLVLGNNAGGIYERIPGYLKLGSGTTTIDGNLSAGGSPNIGDKLDLGSGTLNIVGNFNSNYMTVVPGTSTVNLTGASGSTQTISGNTTFNNLSATSTSARTLRFAAGSTQTVLGTWTGTGAAGQLLMLGLKTGDTGSWNINPMGSRNISYVNVSNSRNTSPIIINPPNSLDSGSNDNWFPPVGTITFSSAKTNQKDQTLALTSYNGAQMKISNVADFAGADYETFSASKAWTLLDPTVDGTKTVYAKFKDIYGNESSTISASITLDMIPTAAPNNLTATAGNTSISLSWTNPKDVDFTTTVLYRSTKSDFVPTIGNNVGHYDEILNNKIANFAGDIQTYLDANVVNGITYYYKVRAIDNVDNYSVESNIASARADNDLPTTPTSLTLSNKTNTKDGMEYINVKDGILSFYPAIDLNSGINKYIISIGTASNSIDVLSSKELLVSSLGNQDKPSIAFSAISSSIAGLADGTYYIRVQAADNLGNLSSVSTELKFMIDTVAPVISGEVNATDVSNRSASLYKALLTWPEATETGSGLIGYVVKRGGEILAPDASLVTGNIQYDAVNKIYSYLDNLGASKSASYTISAVDFAKNESTSLNAKFNGTEAITVILPPEAPGEGTLIITEPKAAPSDSLGEKTMATITWKTSVPATSQILYGESTDYALRTEFDAGLNSFHTVVLKDLKFNTTYHYVVISKDRNGNEVRSDQIAEFKDLTFVTKDVLKDQAVLDTVIQNLSGSLMKVRDIIANMISQTSIVNTNQSIANSLGMKAENVPAATSTVAISVAAAAAAAAPIANAMTLFSLPEYLRALIYSMLSLGTKRKRKEWGRIVEDGTDLPIAQAKILLFKLEKTLNSTYVNKKLIETVYSDADGNYAFIAGPGEYEISVMKDMYYMAENNSKSYKPGSVITVKSEAEGLIVPTIHMSMTPDDTKKKLFSLKRLDNIERALVYISLAFLIFGTITVISGLAKNFTSVTNLILLAVYPFLWYLNIKSLKKSSPFGNVVDKQNSQGVPLSLVRVMSKDGRKLIKTTVTNQTGKFQTLVQKGQYQVKVAKTGYLQAEPAMLDTDRKIESLHERIEMDRDRRI
jgi:hypothetical protein